MDDKFKKFYAKVEKHGGWKQVPAERVHSIFIEVLNPDAMGFVLAKRGYLTRQIDPDIFQVIKLDSLKGGACGLSYGLSLSYVPYPYVPKLKWHRTVKSVSLDLREQPQVHLRDSRGKDAPERLVASTMLGEKCLREELDSIWASCSPRILAWFDSTRNFTGILAKCNEHLKRSSAEIKYLPGARLVRACTYAKLGRMTEAKEDLNTFLQEHGEDSDARAKLHAGLEQIVSESARS